MINIYIDLNLFFNKKNIDKIKNLDIKQHSDKRYFYYILNYFDDNFLTISLIQQYFGKLKKFDKTQIYILSNIDSNNVRYILSKLELIDYFTDVLFVNNNTNDFINNHKNNNDIIYVTKNFISIFNNLNAIFQFEDLITENTFIEIIKKYFTILSNYF